MEGGDQCCVPPGFRFHPTEEELVGYYLTRKVASEKIDLGVINEVDLYRIEPWDLHDRCKLGYEEQKEWYFFSHKDKKYPSGTRTNRATAAGFWKATGRDKAVLSKCNVIGMRKTLVFYEGRAPNGRKSDWIMHEYRLQSSENGPPQEEGWVVCRAFKKPIPNTRPCFPSYNPSHSRDHNDRYGFQPVLLSGLSRSTRIMDSIPGGNLYQQPFGYGEQFESKLNCGGMLEIPRLDSPSMSTSLATNECFDGNVDVVAGREKNSQMKDSAGGQFVDWKVLDNLLASQLSESTSCSKSNLPMIHLDYGTIHDHSLEDQFLASFQD